MRSLETQTSWFARIQIGLAALIVVAAAAFYFIWYRPATHQMQMLRSAILENNHNLEMSRSKADELPAVARMVADLRQKLDRFDRKMPRHQDLPQLLDALESLRQQAGIAKCSLKPDSTQTLASYSEQTIHVDFEGDFDQVADFLARVEDMDRMTRVRRLKVDGGTSGRGSVQVQMDVSIFFLEG